MNIIRFYIKMLLPALLELGELYLLAWLLSKVWRGGFSLPAQIGITGFCLFWAAVRTITVYRNVKSTWNGTPWWLADRY